MASEVGRTHIVDVEAGAAVPPEGHFLYARDTDKLYKSDGSALTELATGGGSYSDEQAQDAVGAMVDTTLVYTDGTPLLSRAALTGDVTASAGSNATTIANDAVTFGKMQNITSLRLLGRHSALTGDVEEVNLGGRLYFSSNSITLDPSVRVLGVTFDGGTSTPTVGSIGYVVCPFAGEIQGWNIVGNSSGSAVVDVWQSAGAIPTNANTIAGTEKPTLSSQQLASDSFLSTWTSLVVTSGDVIGFELESVTTCTRITVEIVINET